MRKVEHEEFVVHVVVSGSTKTQLSENSVPWMWILRVDECKPISVPATTKRVKQAFWQELRTGEDDIQRAKRHVSPNIAIDEVGS